MEHNLGFHCHRVRQIEERILANELARGEFYHFPADELPSLKREIRAHHLAASIHCPLLKPPWYPEPPTWAFLCDVDREKRELNVRMVSETLEMAGDIEAEYVVVHFPSPSFTDSSGRGYDEMRAIALESGHRLATLSEHYGVPIYIEGFGPSPLLSAEFLVEVFTLFPALRYCFDTGHMNIAAARDGFDLYRFVEQVAPYVGAVHLWNSRGWEDYACFHHIPVHPSQDPVDGWADIARILSTITQGRPQLPMVFESPTWYPQALGDHDYRDGVTWVRELLETLS